MIETIFNLVVVKNLIAHRNEIQIQSHSGSFLFLFIFWRVNPGDLTLSVFSAKGKSRGISDDENSENCVRRSTIFNISQQLEGKDGWRMLVKQLQERLGRRDCDDPMKGLVPLREFQKFDSAFPAYLKGRGNKRLLCVLFQFHFYFPDEIKCYYIY